MRVILGKGFIGSALQKQLNCRIVSHKEADLTKPLDALSAVSGATTVFLCAGKTGGVGRMSADPMSFVYPNVRVHMGTFEACVKAGVKRVVCVGSTTGYPDSPEKMREEQYLEGDLHPAYFVPGNAHRFIKRLAMMHKDLETVFFRPSNVYGPGNNFDPRDSHVIEATVRKVAERQDPFVIWGTGNEVRDAIYIDDLAEAMTCGETCEPGDYNVGSGEEMSVNQIADVLLGHAGFRPDIEHDLSKPTAIPARRVDCTKLKALGWRPKVSMVEGLKRTYDWYESLENAAVLD
jgi:GDP-L-fucose synthase